MGINWQVNQDNQTEQVFFTDRRGKLQLSTQAFHPVHQVIDILEEPTNEADYRTLVKATQQRYTDLKCSCVSQEHPLLVAALLKQGFICKRHCYEGTIELQELCLDWQMNTESLQQVSQLSIQKRKALEEQVVAEYRLYHEQVSPLSSTLSTKIVAQQLLDRIDSEHSYVQQKGKNYSYFITEQVADDAVFVTYIGGHEIEELLRLFYEKCLVRLSQEGFTYFEYEIDDTNPKQWLLHTFFEIEEASYDAYIYEV